VPCGCRSPVPQAGALDNRDVLIVKADRQEPLVVVHLSLAMEISQAADADFMTKRGNT
jgi:hypothetical protein